MKNGYALMRSWFDFSIDKKESKTQHTALFAWIVELNNRLAWVDEFRLPSYESMHVLGIGNKNTYLNALRDLEAWGFIRIVQPAKNQWQACVIQVCRGNNDTALIRHEVQHCPSIDTGTDPIIKLEKHRKPINISFDVFWDSYDKKVDKPKCERQWAKLTDRDREAIMAYVPRYVQATPEKRYRKNPGTFLTNRAWENELPNADIQKPQRHTTNATAKIDDTKKFNAP